MYKYIIILKKLLEILKFGKDRLLIIKKFILYKACANYPQIQVLMNLRARERKRKIFLEFPASITLIASMADLLVLDRIYFKY